MRLDRALLGVLALGACLSASTAARAADVSLFNGLPHRVEVVRLLENGAEHRPWSGPMEPGSRWRLKLPAGCTVEFRHDGRAVVQLQVGREARQGHVIRLAGVSGPVPPPPPPGQVSEFPNWHRSRAVRPASAGTLTASATPAPRSSVTWRMKR